jgi:hypothetical protein
MIGRFIISHRLWLLFAIVAALTASFGLIESRGNFVLLDRLSDPAAVRETLAAYTDQQVMAHIWTTAVLDVAYPLAYGTLFALLPMTLFPRGAQWLALPALLVVLADLAEGGVQLAALMGQTQFIGLKAWLTPFKFGLFGLSAVIALAAACYALYRPAARNTA